MGHFLKFTYLYAVFHIKYGNWVSCNGIKKKNLKEKSMLLIPADLAALLKLISMMNFLDRQNRNMSGVNTPAGV